MPTAMLLPKIKQKEMKKLLCLLMLLCALTAKADGTDVLGDEIDLTVSIIEEGSLGNIPQRSPVFVPYASIDGHTFYINCSHPDYVLQLVDVNDGETVLFETFVPAGVNSVVLPSSLEGTFKIQLIYNCWCFWGYVMI